MLENLQGSFLSLLIQLSQNNSLSSEYFESSQLSFFSCFFSFLGSPFPLLRSRGTKKELVIVTSYLNDDACLGLRIP